MKSSVIFLLLAAAAAAPAQPVPEWTSPSFEDCLHGWIILREDPPDVRYYYEDNEHIHIMDGCYSANIAVTIGKPDDYIGLYQIGYDMTGDDIYELMISLFHEQPPYDRGGFQIVNPMNGDVVYQFDDPDYSYYMFAAYGGYLDIYICPDIDNDGWNELVVGRAELSTNESQYLVYQTNGVASVSSGGGNPLPIGFSLNQNYPNPFNPATNISYELAQPGPVEIQIFDPAGRLIRNHNVGIQVPGPHKWIWDGKSSSGAAVASGIYFYTLRAGGRTEAKKMIMLR